MWTPYGKLVRKYRIDHGQTLKDMADSLDISPAYLSAVETGRKNVPHSLVEAVITHFDLDAEKATELREAATQSRRDVKISMDGQSGLKRELATAFARSFQELDSSEVNQMLQVLKKHRKHGG